jgi:hypothetical protein
MPKITQDELNRLKAPFPLKDHSIREGNKVRGGKGIQWFVYANKMAVQNRLDEVFPGEWECSAPVIVTMGNSVCASIGITIRGLTRGDTGEDSNGMEKAKGAATDAFRRAAAKWGISQYLYEMDFKIYTDAYPDKDWDAQDKAQKDAFAKFEQWYNRQFGTQPPRQTPPQSQNTATSSVSTPDVPITLATQTKAPVDALAGNGHDKERKMGTQKVYDQYPEHPAPKHQLWELKNAVLIPVYERNTFHMNGSLTKLIDAKTLHAGLTLEQAVEVVKGRKELEAMPGAVAS